jgi:valyl-tRNA synthetase
MDMTANTPNLSSQYDPSTTESKWQNAWESSQAFKADPSHGGEPYCVVIPPPNVTGSLHMGHAFESSLIDVLVRYHRMIGRNTLWLPGTDHASIAVQTILERQLRDEGKTRTDVGREVFLERAWKWKAESGGTIVDQLRRLGVSVDWSRERFTMDEGLSKAVLEAFVRLYNEGLIYRGSYLVNWCPASQSAIADLEVENKEVDGHLWHFRYPLVDGSGHVEVATTRPETMLGDTAVAVNPQDERYQTLIGKMVRLPILGREIPIIADEFVDPSFGTGCVKVTPAHDLNDFAMGKRHDLPFINILNKDGTLNDAAGPFAGQDRFDARKGVVDQLQAEGLLAKVEDYRHTVPYSDRGKVPVEPLISTQWFVKMETLSQKTLASLDQKNSPHFVPERWRKVYRDWLVNLKDWCISRQLWWGHQIPAWYAVSETEGEIRDNTPFVVAHSAAEAQEKAIAQFGEGVQLQQDPDVLDTWFSSGLWPFSTLGWPDSTSDLATYYPTTTLVTGFDIIFFWVARMTLMASHFTGQIPFQDVYIHGLVRDENGKKMSKSANNGIDPLVLIREYGTDALRYTMIREVAGAGQDISLKLDRSIYDARLQGITPGDSKETLSESVEASRNFANKLWNASRFVLSNLDGQTPAQLGTPALEQLELTDRWILTRYQRVVLQTRNLIETYGLGEAAKSLYEFIWGDFCDWYIELVKARLRQDNTPSQRVAQQTLAYVLEGTLKLLHPFMPHITEELWQTLTQAESGVFLALQPYPVVTPTAKLQQSITQASSNPGAAPRSSDPTVNLTDALRDSVKALDQFPQNFLHFVQENRRSLLLLGAVGAGILSAEILLGVVNTLNQVPLLGAILETIGLIFTGQFIYRKLLWKEKRDAFLQQIRSQTQRIALPLGQPMPMLPPLSPAALSKTETPKVLADLLNTDIEVQFELLFETIRTIRNLRSEASIKPGSRITVFLQSDSAFERRTLSSGQEYIRELAKVETLSVQSQLSEAEQKQTMVGVTGTVQVLIPLAGLIDIQILKAKIEKDLVKAEKEVQSTQGRLSNEKFVSQAPPEVVQGARESLAEAEKQVQILRDRLSRL